MAPIPTKAADWPDEFADARLETPDLRTSPVTWIGDEFPTASLQIWQNGKPSGVSE
jgi:hypothetical protein